MLIPMLRRPTVGPLAIADDSAADSNILFHKIYDGGTIFIRESGDPDSAHTLATNFGSDYHDFFCLPRGIARSQPSDESSIDLNLATELLTPRTDHCPTQFMQHRPGCLITGQPKQSLESHGVDAHLLVGHPPHGPKPQPQGYLASVENSSSGKVDVRRTALAMESSVFRAPRLPCRAPGTDEAFRPADPREVIPT